MVAAVTDRPLDDTLTITDDSAATGEIATVNSLGPKLFFT